MGGKAPAAAPASDDLDPWTTAFKALNEEYYTSYCFDEQTLNNIKKNTNDREFALIAVALAIPLEARSRTQSVELPSEPAFTASHLNTLLAARALTEQLDMESRLVITYYSTGAEASTRWRFERLCRAFGPDSTTCKAADELIQNAERAQMLGLYQRAMYVFDDERFGKMWDGLMAKAPTGDLHQLLFKLDAPMLIGLAASSVTGAEETYVCPDVVLSGPDLSDWYEYIANELFRLPGWEPDRPVRWDCHMPRRKSLAKETGDRLGDALAMLAYMKDVRGRLDSGAELGDIEVDLEAWLPLPRAVIGATATKDAAGSIDERIEARWNELLDCARRNMNYEWVDVAVDPGRAQKIAEALATTAATQILSRLADNGDTWHTKQAIMNQIEGFKPGSFKKAFNALNEAGIIRIRDVKSRKIIPPGNDKGGSAHEITLATNLRISVEQDKTAGQDT